MRYLIFLSLLLLISCSNNKKVYICGDHPCANKKEYSAYFSENLTVEVQFDNKKNISKQDLVSLNLNKNVDKKFFFKNDTFYEKKIKNNNKKIALKKSKENKIIEKNKLFENRKNLTSKSEKNLNNKQKSLPIVNKLKNIAKRSNVNNNKKKLIKTSNICNDIKNCNIEEISNLLINKGLKKDFPKIGVE